MLPSDGHSTGDRKQRAKDDKNGETATTAAFVTSVTDIDIILGRGRYLIQRPGNVAFRLLCQTRKEEYLKAPNRNAKDQIARELIEEVTKRKGRFLRKIETVDEAREVGVPEDVEESWRVVEYSVVLEKTKQTLRDKEYIKSGDRAAKLATDSNKISVDTPATGNPLFVLPRAAETEAVPNSQQRFVSRASPTGQERRSISNTQAHHPLDASPPPAGESLFLLTLQQEQNRIRQMQQQLAELQYRQQLRLSQSLAASGFQPYVTGGLLEQEVLRLQSSHAAAPYLFHPPSHQLSSRQDFNMQQRVGSSPSLVEQRLRHEQESETKQQDPDHQGLSNNLFSRDEPQQFMPMPSTQLLHGFPPEIAERRILEMYRRHQMDLERLHTADGSSFAASRLAVPAVPPFATGRGNNNTFHRPTQFLPSGLTLQQYGSAVEAAAVAADPARMSFLLRQGNLPPQMPSPTDLGRIPQSREQAEQRPQHAENSSATKSSRLEKAPSPALSSSSGETEDEPLNTKPPAKKHKK